MENICPFINKPCIKENCMMWIINKEASLKSYYFYCKIRGEK